MVLGVVGFFFLPIQLFFFTGLGVVISILGLMVYKITLSKMYPVEVRIWEKRFGKPTIVEATRGKRAMKENIEIYQCVNRLSFKAPAREFIIASPKGHFIDLFRLSKHQYAVIEPNFDLVKKLDDDGKPVLDDNKNQVYESFKAYIIPDDDIRTLADLTIKTVEVTKPIEDRLAKLMPIMIIAVTGIVLMIMLVTFMQYFPDYVREMANVMSAQINALQVTTDQFTSAVNNYTAVVGGANPPSPPPDAENL